MIDHLLMLSCGWVGGVVSTLLIRHALDGRRPLDPALLPTSVVMPIAALPALPPAPHLSPYAPKPKIKPAPLRPAFIPTERMTTWLAKQGRPPVPPPQPPPPPKPPAPVPPPPATALLPSIAWGTPHGGEGQTLTEAFKTGLSTAENGHSARAPRRRA